MHDGDLFTKDGLHDAIGGDPILYKAVMKMTVNIYKDQLMYERPFGSNSAVKVLAVDEKGAEEVPLESQSVGEHLDDEARPPEECPSHDVIRNRFQPGKEAKPATVENHQRQSLLVKDPSTRDLIQQCRLRSL
ncbi:hypothetical protein BDW59DRAFT_157602 [Aspergillus cavernicola]|uniref:Uncharacterized protein n=1 Tax=Aspergillus cavernicola TaxID=176166 RepID=A0ABR4IWK3_9EURO